MEESFVDKNKSLVIFVGIFVILVIVVFLFFIGFKMIKSSKDDKKIPVPIEEKEEDLLAKALGDIKTGELPSGEEIGDGNGNGNGRDSEWEVENFGFGDFYEEPDTNIELNFSDISLPINVKIEVDNYHDINRKIDLEASLESLNKNGFAILDNPFKNEADNFYAFYGHIDEKQLPILITSDFLLYYYQNTLKSAYKEIESTTFYNNLWETNLSLYKIAKARYEERKKNVGLINEPTLEAERLELAFFATALSLLKPKEEQINREATLKATDKFSVSEAEYYSFTLPTYLADNVEKEIELIEKAEETKKSPILMYERDYTQFKVPKDYLDSSRLQNFYLASNWLNSVFPLYYLSDECPNCLLDKDDWRINFYAATLLAEDFSENQELQNRWAKIYKLMSFFSGLRSDITYLYYKNVFDDLFGDKSQVIDIFSVSKEEMDEKFLAMRDKLMEFNFSEIEGAINKSSTSTRPLLGMKMLAQAYWPNDYIIKEFTSDDLGLYKGKSNIRELDPLVKTACEIKGKINRCFFSAYDIINLIYPIKETFKYFAVNSEYENYDVKEEKMRSQLRDFSVGSWHSNNYWSNLSISQKFLETSENQKQDYARTNDWIKKEIGTAIGSWLDVQVEADILTIYQSHSLGGLEQINQGNQYTEYAYVEPNYVLVSELVANTNMLLKMLDILNITEKDNEAIFKLKTMKKDLDTMSLIVKKELAGEDLSQEDYKFLGSFPKTFSVKREGNKEILLRFKDTRNKLSESIKGLRVLIVTYKKGEKTIFAVGPVFNFWESRR